VLHDGIQTNEVGHFLLIPFLKQLGVMSLAEELGLKSRGIPVLKDVLLWTNLLVSGKKRASKVGDLTDLGIAVSSGFPVLPDQSHLHRFLKRPSTNTADRFIRAIGREQYRIGQIDGSIVSFDSHLIPYHGKMDLQKDVDGKSPVPFKAVKVHAVLDQKYRNPVYLMARYPGKTAVKIGDDLTDASMEIIPDKKILFTMDRWFSVGELLDHIRQKGQRFITLIRRHQKRIREMERIPLESFRKMTDIQGVTSIKTRLRNYNGPIRLVVVEDLTEGIRTYYGYIINDDHLSEEEVIQTYSGRWGIETWFNECSFFGINHLPSIELNEVTMHLGMNLIAYNVISAFRANMGEPFIPMNAETISKKFFKEQALIRLRNNQITVTIYGHRYKEILEPLYYDIDSKLTAKGINPKIPWMNDNTLKFEFK